MEYVAEMDPGISDDVVLERARQQDMVLVTSDRDFGEMVFREKRASAGVILLRLSGLSLQAKATIVATALREHEAALVGAFSVVTPALVRIRRDLN